MKPCDSKIKLPELLSPAGSPEALCAAVEGGADAVYFGGSLFSNRMRAKNFDTEELVRYIALCKAYSVRSYITLNTRLRDVELAEACELAVTLYAAGADAFIVADAGLAAAIRERLPDAELHASTQMTGVNAHDAAALASLGFSRMVCPRELSRDELSKLVKASPVEIEMFVHGAHCVSVSGQCLMSWAMGGRSGNRGECAQPCRLPYRVSGCKNISRHPLSLKDMCLAQHLPEILELGVSSLKIEGRLKSADYVYGVTKIWRNLLNERRPATRDEMVCLDGIFSRNGFTDGYFKKSYSSMNGMRSESAVTVGEKFGGLTKKIPVTAHAEAFLGKEATLTLSCMGVSVTVTGETVQEAKSAPIGGDMLYRNISKLGGMPYSLAREDFTYETDGRGFLTVSQINALRRSAAHLLEPALAEAAKRDIPDALKPRCTEITREKPIKTAFFASPDGIPRCAADAFDVIFLPHKYVKSSETGGKAVVGLSLPLWQTDSDTEEVKAALARFAAAGGKYVLAHSYSQLTLSAERGLIPIASERLNITNCRAAEVMKRLGARYVILSPELKAPAIRDAVKNAPVSCGCTVYGRLPVMMLRRCILSDSGCSGNCGGAGCLLPKAISDRKGARLSVVPLGNKMNLILNPNPLWCADKCDLGGLYVSHFLFTTESSAQAAAVIDAYRRGLSPEQAGVMHIKRI